MRCCQGAFVLGRPPESKGLFRDGRSALLAGLQALLPVRRQTEHDGMTTRMTQACERCYDGFWTLTAGAGCAVGLIAAVRTSGALVAASILVITATLEVLLVLPWLPVLGWRVRPVLVCAPVFGLIMVVMMGLLVVLGPVSVAIGPVLLLASPFTREGVRRVVPSRRASQPALVPDPVAMPEAPSAGREAPRPPDDPGFAVPDQLSVADVCQAWRSSYVALERASSLESRLRVVRMRAIYLDELGRMAGPATCAWLRSGARAAGDPSRWVVPRMESTDPSRTRLD